MKPWKLGWVFMFFGLTSVFGGGDGVLLKYARDGDASGLESSYAGLGANINCRDEEGMTPLMITAQYTDWIHFDTMKTILKIQSADVNLTDNKGHTAYFYAKQAGNQRGMDLLISKGADPNLQGPLKSSGGAASAMDSVKKLFNFGKKTEVKTESKVTTVPVAKTTTPPAPKTGVEDKKLSVGKNETQNPAPAPSKIEISTEASTQTTLIDVVKTGNAAEVKTALGDINNLVNVQDQNGWSPLMYAIQTNQSEIVQMLLERGANVNFKDLGGWTPLMLAANNGNDSMVDLILARTPDVNARTEKGTTALIVASGRGHSSIVQKLLAARATVALKDDSGKTAMGYATEKNHPEVVEILKKTGALQ